MYSEGTCHKKGVNLKKKKKAEKQLKYFITKIQNLTEKLKFVLKDPVNLNQTTDSHGKYSSNKTNNGIHDTINGTVNNKKDTTDPHESDIGRTFSKISGANIVAGFVTFEYCQGMKRCVDDYAYFNSFPRNLLFYPKKLKFKGQRIKVDFS
jgi:hypothetical protein